MKGEQLTLFPMEPSPKDIERLENLYAGRGIGKPLYSLLYKIKSLDPEYAELVNKHFWKLV